MARGSEILARFQTTTPMFPGEAGGSDGIMGAEIRPTAIKAALRFWWRSLAYARLGNDTATLKREEDALFGAPADDEGGRQRRGGTARGQAAFMLRLTSAPAAETDLFPPGSEPLPASAEIDGAAIPGGVAYLGYGPVLYSRDLGGPAFHRRGIKPGTIFSIALRCRADSDVDGLIAALKLFGLLGGMGARSRRGFGSVALLDLVRDGEAIFSPPETLRDYVQRLKAVLPATYVASARARPDWSAFAPGRDGMRGSVCAIVAAGKAVPLAGQVPTARRPQWQGQRGSGGPVSLHAALEFMPPSWSQTLNMLGVGMMLYRSSGRNGKIAYRDKPAWRQFHEDHDWFYEIAGGQTAERVPERVAFGVPLPFYSSTTNRKVTVGAAAATRDRRASPVLMHVHRVGQDYLGVITILPGRYLPDGDSFSVKRGDQPVGTLTAPSPDAFNFDPLFDLIDGHGRPPHRQSPFRVVDGGWILTGRPTS